MFLNPSNIFVSFQGGDDISFGLLGREALPAWEGALPGRSQHVRVRHHGEDFDKGTKKNGL